MLLPLHVLLSTLACSGDTIADDAPAGNEAPSAPGVAIAPAEPTDGDELVCSVIAEATDPDGDALSYRYAWAIDGADAGVDLSRVTPDATQPGDTWTCMVTAWDGLAAGPAATASVTIAADAAPNEAPTEPGVAIVPATPRDADALECVVATPATDPDGDALTYAYAWTVDGADAGVSTAAVAAEATEVGEVWTCTVHASDGRDVGPSATASATIAPDFGYSFVDWGFFRGVSCVTHPQFADLTGDGRLDLLCTDVADRMVAMERGGAADSPTYTSFWYLEHPGCCGDDGTTLTAGALQAGALPSVLVAYGDGDDYGYSGNVHLIPNDAGTLALRPSWTLLGEGLSSWSQSARTADIDGNGDPELLITSLRPYAGFATDGLRIFDLDASGMPSTLLWTDDAPAVVAATADLDGDGDAELLACGMDPLGGGVDNADAWAARLYTGSPSYRLAWTAPTTTADGADAACGFADFDGDGDQDVIVLSETDASQGLRAFENVDGAISLLPAAQVITSGRSLHAADWDGDGRDELLVGTASTTTVVDLDVEAIEASVTACGWGQWLDWNEDGAADMVCLATNGVYAYRAQ